ncbi:MAG TPA: hypothetical protein VGN57_03055 [Pirellulaceae bacterium]|nr:hypothetical protein [Pirellulaceae bacterium]
MTSVRTVRPAPVPRSADQEGYFRPLYQPPKTQSALEQVVEFEMVDQPMERLFAGLEETTGVPFYLDETGLEEAAITSDAEITCRSAGMPLYAALDLIVRDLDLAYVVHDEYVQITSRESAELTLETRLFALGDHPLLHEADAAKLVSVIQRHASHSQWSGWWSLKADLLPGVIVLSGERDTLPRAEEFLRQYARLMAEYDAAPDAISASSSPAERADTMIPVHRTPAPRNPARYFQPARRLSKAELALEQPADFHVEETSLERFFLDRESVLGIPFRLDAQQMQSSHIQPDDTISFRAKGMSHAAALGLMLRNLDLKFVPLEDYVLITSVDDERYQVAKRTYQVAGHPLLTRDGGSAFLKSLRRHIAIEGAEYPKEYGIGVRDGRLVISADEPMLDQAETYLKQYGRLLAAYDAVDRSALPPETALASTVADGTSGDVRFRPLWYRPRTLRALERPATIDLQDVPLETFFADLERELGVVFDLDYAGLEEAALTSDSEVTFRASGMSYAAALSQMLQGLDLAFVATDHYVTITSRDAADLETETRLYAVLDHPRLRGQGLRTLIASIEDHLGDGETRNHQLLIDLLPGALIVTGDRHALEWAEERLQPYGLAPAEYAPENPAPSKPPLKFRLPPRLVYPAPPRNDPISIPPGVDPFAVPPGADPFRKPPADPFGDSLPDPFAPPAGSGR